MSTRKPFNWNYETLKATPWVAKGFGLRRSVTLIAATGGTGKTQFSLQCAVAFALGEPFAGFMPMKRLRSVFITGEEDLEELQRRLAAVILARTAGDRAKARELNERLDGWLIIYEGGESDALVIKDEAGRISRTAFHAKLLADNLIEPADIFWCDPLIRLHSGLDENSSTDMQALHNAAHDIAKHGNCCVVLVHHTSKAGSSSVSSSHSARGSSALTDAVRVSINMANMSEAEGKQFFPDDPEAYLDHVQIADPKQNYARKSKPKFFKKESVQLPVLLEDNSPDFRFNLAPAKLQVADADILEMPRLKEFLSQMQAGPAAEKFYTAAKTGDGARADLLLASYGYPKQQCHKALETLVLHKMLEIKKVRQSHRRTYVYQFVRGTPLAQTVL